MKKHSVPALALLVFTLQAAPAGAEPCAAIPVPPVEVKLDYTAPQDDTGMTAQQLDAQYANDKSASLVVDRRGPYIGFIRNDVSEHVNVLFGGKINLAKDAVCPTPDKVEYTIVYKPAFFFASDFKNDGCRYRVSYQHAKARADAFTQSINDTIPEMKKAIEDHFAAWGQQPSVTQLALPDRKSAIVAEVDEAVKPVMEKLNAINSQRQAALSAGDTYSRDAGQCPGAAGAAFAP